MKSLILTAIAILGLAAGSSAQFLPPDYRFEIGVNGGVSTTTVPLGPAAAYQGSKNTWNPVYGINLTYNIFEKLMVSLEATQTKWITKGEWASTITNNQQIAPKEITYQYANPATSFYVAVNGLIPFTSRYGDYNKANIHYGIGGGVVATLNDGNIGYTEEGDPNDPTFKYVTQYNYGFGFGGQVGAQVGFTYYIIPKLGININLAARYVGIRTNEDRYGQMNNYYRMLYFPHTLGVRFRF